MERFAEGTAAGFCAGVVRAVDIVEPAKPRLAKSVREAEINLAAERIAPRKQ